MGKRMWWGVAIGAAVGVLGLSVAVGVTGHSPRSSEQYTGGMGSEAVPMPTKAPLSSGGAGAPAQGSAKTGPTLTADEITRSIVYTGRMTVRVTDVDRAAGAADTIATGAGGYVGGDDRDINASQSVATLTLRVPAPRFQPTVAALGALGKETGRTISTQDVTGSIVDVQSRLKTQKASVDRIRALMASTTSIGQIESLEDELTDREADLESMEAQLHELTDLSSLSTITVELLGPEAKAAPQPSHHGRSGFTAGLTSGWHGFLASMKVLLTVLGAVLPFAVVVGVPAWIVFWLIRRRRRAVPTAASPGE